MQTSESLLVFSPHFSLSFLSSSQEDQKSKERAKESVRQEEEAAEGGRMCRQPDGRASLRKHRGLERAGL